MYRDYNEINEYPFHATFYRIGVDESKPLDEQVQKEIVVFETKCDITESSHTRNNNFISASFVIYFPFNKEKEQILVKRGDLVRANQYGLLVDGKVVGVFPSQLGGCTIYIQDTDI